MNTFELPRENKDASGQANKNLTDAAVLEAMERIRDQILFLRDNSKDISIRHHLKEINADNKDKFLEKLSSEDVIDFNEVILKGNWRTYLERKNKQKLTKYIKEEVLDQNLTSLEKDRERLIPADNFRLSFQAMIDHYAKNLEIEEYEKKKETERHLLRREFALKLDELEKIKPHIVAEIRGIDPDIFRKPDYQVALNLNEESLGDYERGLKKYFNIKLGGKDEEKPMESKAQLIEKDQRFRYYCALRAVLGFEDPCTPEFFLNNN